MWLKYGQKQLTGGTHGRHYYRCSHFRQPTECRARRVVDFHKHDPKFPLRISFFGEHNHPPPLHRPPQPLAAPQQNPSAAAAQPASAGATVAQASSAGASAPRSSRHAADRLRLSLPDDVIGSTLAGGASAASAGGASAAFAGGGGSGARAAAAGFQPGGGGGAGEGGIQAGIHAGLGGRLPYSLAELEVLAAVLLEAAATSAAAGSANAPLEGSRGRADATAAATNAATATTYQRVSVNERACASSVGGGNGGGSIGGSRSRAVAAEREHQLLESLVNLLTSPVASPGSGSASLTPRPSSAPSPRELHSPMQTGALLSPASAVAAAYPHCASYPSYRSSTATSPSSMTSASGSMQFSPHATGPTVHTGTRFGVPSASPGTGAPSATAASQQGPSSAQSQQQLAAAAILAHLLAAQARQSASPRTPNPVHEAHGAAPAPRQVRETQGAAPAPRFLHEAQGRMHQPHVAMQQPLNVGQGGLVSPPRPALSCPPEGRLPAPPPLFIPRPASSPAEYFSASAAISSPRGTSVNCQVSTWPPAQEQQGSQPWAAGQGPLSPLSQLSTFRLPSAHQKPPVAGNKRPGDAASQQQLPPPRRMSRNGSASAAAGGVSRQQHTATNVSPFLVSEEHRGTEREAAGAGEGSVVVPQPGVPLADPGTGTAGGAAVSSAAAAALSGLLQQGDLTKLIEALSHVKASDEQGGREPWVTSGRNQAQSVNAGSGPAFPPMETGRANGAGSSCLFNNQSGFYAADAAAGGEGNFRFASSDLPSVFHHSPDSLQKQIQDAMDQQELDAAMLAAVTAGTVGASAGAGSAGEITMGENGCSFYGSSQAASHSQSGGFGCDLGSRQQQHTSCEEQNGGSENALAMMALLRTLTDPDDHMTLDG
ncbi:unnamed protein product [Closterium sp. Naga37s-1]|nr:unnamed protein product [Closterium sp. Naga37s-1]